MKLLAIDSNSILNRAFYGVRPLTTREGQHTNAIFGFLNILFKICQEVTPDVVVFAFDLKAPTFRHKMFEGYKAQRKGMPPELASQLEPMKEILQLMGYPIIAIEGYEADDILGTLASNCKEKGWECVIATGDRDSFQLVGEGVTVRLASTKMGQSVAEIITTEYIKEKYGVSPKQLIEVKALMGDSSDNIPGVAGVGEKTALSLISAFENLENLYQNIEDPQIKKGAREKLINDKEMAFTSRELATINCSVPLEQSLEELKTQEVNSPQLYNLLEKLELKSLIAKMNLTKPTEEELGTEAVEFAESLAKVNCYFNSIEVLQQLLTQPALTAVFNIKDEQLVSFGVLGKKAVVIDNEEIVHKGAELFAEYKGEITMADCKSWYRYSLLKGQQPTPVSFDPALAGYLLSPLSSSYDVFSLCAGKIEPSVTFLFEEEVETPQPILEQLTLLPNLAKTQKQELAQKEMEKLLYEVEQPLSMVLASMESVGFLLDSQGLTDFGKEIDSQLQEITQRIYFLAEGEFNINSPKQLGEVLFERLKLPTGKKTKTGYSTNADTLENLRGKHPVIEDILEFRKLAKLKSTYVDGLLSKVEADGKVRTIFKQTETRTGRISSTEPNLQNIPIRTERGSRLRKFFVAPENHLLVDADYSQIELRVLAAISNDEKMISAFSNNQDIHTKTAAEVFNMPESFVTPQMRFQAKAVNFGIVYGIGAFSLAQDIDTTVAQADQYIKNYLATYSGVDKYMKEVVEFAKENGYSKTLFGRRRPVPEINASNKREQAFGVRIAMNTPIQGTAADIIKIAMVKVYNRIKAEGLKAQLILQVHDELIVQTPAEELEQVKALLAQEMEHAADLAVKLSAEAHYGTNWLEAK